MGGMCSESSRVAGSGCPRCPTPLPAGWLAGHVRQGSWGVGCSWGSHPWTFPKPPLPPVLQNRVVPQLLAAGMSLLSPYQVCNPQDKHSKLKTWYLFKRQSDVTVHLPSLDRSILYRSIFSVFLKNKEVFGSQSLILIGKQKQACNLMR